jgi:hypothetical protein
MSKKLQMILLVTVFLAGSLYLLSNMRPPQF